MVRGAVLRWMVVLASFVIPLVFIHSDVKAQSEAAEEKKRPNSLVPGAWALQFEVGENFSIEDFQGFLLSAKKHLAARKAIRVGFGFSGEASISASTSKFFDGDTSFQNTYKGPQDYSQTFDLVVQFISVPAPEKDVNLFLGLGPLFRFSHSGSEMGYQGLTYERDVKTWVLGAMGILGVEWFATKSISFLAEYGVAFEYQNRTDESKSFDYLIPEQTVNGITRHSVRFEPNPLKVGLSVYF